MAAWSPEIAVCTLRQHVGQSCTRLKFYSCDASSKVIEARRVKLQIAHLSFRRRSDKNSVYKIAHAAVAKENGRKMSIDLSHVSSLSARMARDSSNS